MFLLLLVLVPSVLYLLSALHILPPKIPAHSSYDYKFAREPSLVLEVTVRRQ